MPRKGKGGSRNGQAGQGYSNRKDLNTALPKQAAPSTSGGRQYGDRKADMDAQSVVPLAPPPGEAPPAPGQLGPLAGPSRRPNEPVTTGVDAGPGRGSEVLRYVNQQQAAPRAISVIEELSAQVSDPYVESLTSLIRGRRG